MTPTPELLALKDVCARLKAVGIEYMLTGSLAMTYYARPRMTRGIDVVVALATDAAPLVAAALGADYYVDVDAVTDAIRTRRPCNAIYFMSSLPEGLTELERKRELCRRFYGDVLARKAYG